MCSLRDLSSGAARLGVVAAACFFTGVRDIDAQITDPVSGRITSNNWLALGPFTNQFGCSGANGDLLTLHLAPSSIHCLFPELGDEVDYDAAQASTTGYTGPLSNGKPAWQLFNDGLDDSDLNMDGHAGADISDVMMYVVTYIENTTATDQAVDLCIGSDDGVQVWIDQTLVHNNNACRGWGECQDNVPVTITPGFHRIAMAVWERAGGWGGSLGLRQGGVPILDTDPNWFFWGFENPGMAAPATCNLYERVAVSASDPSTCPPQTGGSLTVTISGNIPAGPNIPEIKDMIRGPLGAAQVSIPGGALAATITSVLPSGGPMTPTGSFQDARTVLERPICGTGNGGVVHNNAGTPADPSDDSYEITNVGEDIWAVGDSFTYAYNKVQGDFDVSAHVASRTPTPGSRWGKHGIMARQDLSTRSRYTFTHDAIGDMTEGMDLDNNDDSTIQANRPTHGGTDNFEIGPFRLGDGTVDVDDYCDGVGPDDGDCLVVHHDYLRLTRVGSVFTSYSRASPADPWTLLASNDWGSAAPAVVLVGLAVTSHSFDCANPIEIVFDEVDYGGATLAPAVIDPFGAEVTWTNVARSDVTAGNLRYTITIPAGVVNFVGQAGADPILGSGSAVVLPPLTNYGPLTNPDFTHAHNIGAQCTGTSITTPAPGALVIDGAGTDIWQGGDQFMFAYNAVTGDFSARVTITERVFSTTSPGWGKHGIMARQDCSTRSRYTFMHDHDDEPSGATHPTRLAHRPTHGGTDNFEITPFATVPDHHASTLRLDRCGDEFIGYVLDELGSFGGNPGDWVEIGRNTWVGDVPETVQLGLAVTSHDACNITTITFEDWEVQPACDAPVGNLSCVTGASTLDMTWTNPNGANTAVPISIVVNGVQFGTVPGTSTSASIPLTEFPAGVISRIDVFNSSGIAGTCAFPPEFNPSGFIKNWLILGPYTRLGGAAPGVVEMQFDYLTDGVTTEANVMPAAGQSIMTDYYDPVAMTGLSNSTGLAPTPGRPDINPGGVPTWFEWRDPDDTVDFADVFNQDLNDVMCFAATYVTVDAETTVDLGIGSDDAVQVLLDGVEVWINNIARGDGGPNVVQDVVPGITLTAGCHLIILKVFEGAGGHTLRLRLQDATLQPILPSGAGFACGGGGPGDGFRRGDSDTSGQVNLTDAIRILNVLFLGIGTIVCDDAADSDDSGDVNLTDAIRVLNVLFLGIGSIGPPGVDNCGPDPTDDALTCAEYPASC